MFNNYIFINSNSGSKTLTQNETIPNFLLKYLIVFLALTGMYKLAKWATFIVKFFLKKRQQPLVDWRKIASKKTPIRKKAQHKFKWHAETEFVDEPEISRPRENFSRVHTQNNIHFRPKNEPSMFRSAELKTCAGSESIMGVATAAATAATVFMDRRRHKCCGKCCGKRERV